MIDSGCAPGPRVGCMSFELRRNTEHSSFRVPQNLGRPRDASRIPWIPRDVSCHTGAGVGRAGTPPATSSGPPENRNSSSSLRVAQCTHSAPFLISNASSTSNVTGRIPIFLICVSMRLRSQYSSQTSNLSTSKVRPWGVVGVSSPGSADVSWGRT